MTSLQKVQIASDDPAALRAQVAALHRALAAVGATPHGFCCCPGRNATKPEEAHVGECREARAVLRDAEGMARAHDAAKDARIAWLEWAREDIANRISALAEKGGRPVPPAPRGEG